MICFAKYSNSLLLAKLVGGCHKPNMQTTLFPEYAGKFVSSLQARELPGKDCAILVSLWLSLI